MRQLSGAVVIEGKEAAVAWFLDWFSRFDSDYRIEVDESRDLGGGKVVVVTTHRSKGRASGVPVTQETAQVLTIRDGKIVQQDFLGSRAEALEFVGQAE